MSHEAIISGLLVEINLATYGRRFIEEIPPPMHVG
jgi:hypothetical protein